MRVARQIRAQGRVQGVFFRAWTRDQAQRLGVAGWVRNCSDGSVEARLEGETGAVDQLITLMRRGPPGARVDNLEASDSQPQDLSGFEVRS